VDPSIKAEPIQNGRQGGGRGQGGGGRGQQPRRSEGGAPKSSANRRVVTTMLNRRVKTRGAAAKGNRQGKGSADAARVNLLTRSNLEARRKAGLFFCGNGKKVPQ
jgi:hypothetical protein